MTLHIRVHRGKQSETIKQQPPSIIDQAMVNVIQFSLQFLSTFHFVSLSTPEIEDLLHLLMLQNSNDFSWVVCERRARATYVHMCVIQVSHVRPREAGAASQLNQLGPSLGLRPRPSFVTTTTAADIGGQLWGHPSVVVVLGGGALLGQVMLFSRPAAGIDTLCPWSDTIPCLLLSRYRVAHVPVPISVVRVPVPAPVPASLFVPDRRQTHLTDPLGSQLQAGIGHSGFVGRTGP